MARPVVTEEAQSRWQNSPARASEKRHAPVRCLFRTGDALNVDEVDLLISGACQWRRAVPVASEQTEGILRSAQQRFARCHRQHRQDDHE